MSAFIFDQPSRPIVAGTQGVSVGTFTRIGAISIAGGVPLSLVATINTSNPLNACELRLFDVVAALPVAGSTVSTVSTQGVTLTAPVTLPAAVTLYDLQLRLVTAAPADRAICTSAQILPG